MSQHAAISPAETADRLAISEIIEAYLFPLTKTIRFAHAITLVPKKMNHAVGVASRAAVQDILSGTPRCRRTEIQSNPPKPGARLRPF